MKNLIKVYEGLVLTCNILAYKSISTPKGLYKTNIVFATLLITFLIVFYYGCKKNKEIPNLNPSCKIISPYSGYITEQGATLSLVVEANDKDGQIKEILFLINGISAGFSSALPYNYTWDTYSIDTGSYLIKAIAKDNLGSTATDEISLYLTETGSILAHPVASFSTSETSVFSGSSVQFTDLTSNLPTTWYWDFGDGNTSTLQNPAHTYAAAGNYTVFLQAWNQYGDDTIEKEKFITVTDLEFETSTVSDYDGNSYKTIKIGNQWWMAENLKTTHMANGTEIQLVESNSEWENLSYSNKAYCFYDNSLVNASIYGALYTWAAATNGEGSSETNPSGIQGICPCDWHLPSDTEWMELEMFLGMSYDDAYNLGWRGTDEGDKLKSTSGWYDNGNGNNSSGFSALPAGQRIDGSFNGLTSTTLFWTSTEYFRFTYLAFNRKLSYNKSGIGWFKSSHYYGYPKNYGFSVRCVKN